MAADGCGWLLMVVDYFVLRTDNVSMVFLRTTHIDPPFVSISPLPCSPIHPLSSRPSSSSARFFTSPLPVSPRSPCSHSFRLPLTVWGSLRSAGVRTIITLREACGLRSREHASLVWIHRREASRTFSCLRCCWRRRLRC